MKNKAELAYAEIDAPHGHDAFLMEVEQTAVPIRDLLDRLDEIAPETA